jgi:hypothetical protein
MENLIIEGGIKTPSVNLDPEKRQLRFEGRSIPEDTIRFYEPILKWIEEYIQTEREHHRDAY